MAQWRTTPPNSVRHQRPGSLFSVFSPLNRSKVGISRHLQKAWRTTYAGIPAMRIGPGAVTAPQINSRPPNSMVRSHPAGADLLGASRVGGGLGDVLPFSIRPPAASACGVRSNLLPTELHRVGDSLDIIFRDHVARDLFCRRERLERALGPELARIVCCRLAVLRAAPMLDMVPKGPPIGLRPVRGSQAAFAVSLGASHRLRFETARPRADGGEVTCITIVGVEPAPAHREGTP